MSDILQQYRQATKPITGPNVLWPLYGAGMENLGKNDAPIEVPMPDYGPDELLARHDACGLCFSDIKVINLGQEHPRIFRDIRKEPVVLGHEVAITIVGVGENLRDQYKVGDRFIIQAEIYKDGINYAYGYMIQGGLSKYGVIDQRILNGDHGNYLIPVKPATGYAESALAEPWACVAAAYHLEYRTSLKPGGTTWIIGTPNDDNAPYQISQGFDESSHPSRLVLTQVPAPFEAWLRACADHLHIEIREAPDPAHPPLDFADDIVVLGSDPDLVEMVSPHIADFGVLAVVSNVPFSRKLSIDVGRVHYHRWVYVGSTSPDIAAAYSDIPVRSELKPGGRAWLVGAGGPMGRMHLQRALQIPNGPQTVVCTDVSDVRLQDLCESFGAEAQAKGIEMICLNPAHKESYLERMEEYAKHGFDDIVVLAPIAAVIADAADHLAPDGVMNVFAGVARGTMADLDMNNVVFQGMRYIGHSASSLDDLKFMLFQTESGVLSPNRSVAAVGSLTAAKDGMQALKDTVYPGKVVIFPQIRQMPLTDLAELETKMPTVFARLKDGREWTLEAEEEFLRLMLED